VVKHHQKKLQMMTLEEDDNASQLVDQNLVKAAIEAARRGSCPVETDV
jgi:hypothetical protein